MINRLTSSLDFQGNALMLRAERQQIIAGNIANADTPGYVAREMDFAAALRDASGLTTPSARLAAAGAGRTAPAGAMALTAAGHIASVGDAAVASAASARYATPSQTNLDGNSVDMDRERASFVDNSVKYEATLRFINGSVRTMLDAMRSHTQG